VPENCPAQATVHADPSIAKGEAGLLVCTLPPDHAEWLHYDGADDIWWSRDQGDTDG
jgi:hypothetical protein